jgi:hypothetical protein
MPTFTRAVLAPTSTTSCRATRRAAACVRRLRGVLTDMVLADDSISPWCPAFEGRVGEVASARARPEIFQAASALAPPVRLPIARR